MVCFKIGSHIGGDTLKIIYKQSDSESIFSLAGMSSCCLKQLSYSRDAAASTKKAHHHTGFEIHIIENGHQTYNFFDKSVRINSGEFLLIPPELKHKMEEFAPDTEKFSLTFSAAHDSLFYGVKTYTIAKTDAFFSDNFRYILEEKRSPSIFASRLIENRIFELAVRIARLCGIKAPAPIEDEYTDTDSRVSIVKQYINDNIELNLTASDVAAYCYLSTKQLTRIFLASEGQTPTQYIQKQRTKHIEKLLATSMPLREISELMNFSSEYHFNAFFKNHAGMPPGTYRKMIK